MLRREAYSSGVSNPGESRLVGPASPLAIAYQTVHAC